MNLKYDVFLSHSENDMPVVEKLARKLEKQGLSIWLDDWHLIPGQPKQEGVEEALDQCAAYAVFIGPSGVSGWHNEQMRSALEDRVQSPERRVIPVLLPGAPELIIPRFLKRVTLVDFRVGLDDENALHRLVCGIKGIAPGSSLETISKAPSLEDTPPPPADLPPGSHIPFLPNYLFAGRVRELNMIASALLPQAVEGLAPPQVVTGMGGLGKTQLAVEFAHRYGQLFRGVHWLSLADTSRVDFEIALNGEKMGLPNWPQDQPSQVNYTLQQWEANGPRLIVLDNFEDVETAPEILARFRHSNLRILITSRRADWPPATGVEILTLGFLDARESLKFLKTSLKNRKDSEVDLLKLAERFGYLPLALELAERYLAKQPRLGIDAYLAQLETPLDHESMKEWRKDLPNPTKHDIDLFGTIRSSWNSLPGDTPRLLLILAGYLAPNQSIPFDIFEKYFGLTPQECDSNLEILYGFGLMRQNEDSLPYVHPLVAEFARQAYRNMQTTKGQSPEDRSKTVIGNLASVLLLLSNTVLDSYAPADCAPYYPHMKQIALQAEEIQNEYAGALLNNCGVYLFFLGDLHGSQNAYQQAIDLDTKAHGPNSVHVAASMKNLANIFKESGDNHRALELFQSALQIDESQATSNEKEIADSLGYIATTYLNIGEFKKARETFLKALRFKRRVYPRGHLNLAGDYSGLGAVEIQKGSIRKAHYYLKLAVQIREANLPADHPTLANTLSTLGMVLREMGKPAEAEELLNRARKIYETAYGPDHYNVAEVLSKLGVVYVDTGRFVEAKQVLESALHVFERVFGTDNVNLSNTLANLGMTYMSLNDLGAAQEVLERALKIAQTAHGQDDYRIGETLANLGVVYMNSKQFPKARQALEQAIGMLETHFGKDSIKLNQPLNSLGIILHFVHGEKEKAIALVERAIFITKKHRPHDEASLENFQKSLEIFHK